MKTAINILLSVLTVIICMSCTSAEIPDHIRNSQKDVTSRVSNDWGELTVSFDVEINASGIFNMAFQIWAVKESVSEKSSISHEIMIWTIDQSPRQWAVHQGSFKYGNVTFEVYTRAHHTDDSGVNTNKLRYIAFVPNESIFKKTLHIDEFFDYLIKKTDNER